VHAECGDVAGARALHAEEEVLARQLGAHIWIADVLANLGRDLMQVGELDEARRHLTEAIAVAGECTERVIFPLLHLGDCALLTGRPAEALAVVARFRAEYGAYTALLIEVRRLEAEAWRAQGRGADAEAALREVVRDAEAIGYGPPRWSAGLALAEMRVAHGRGEDAGREAGAVLAVLRRVQGELPTPLGQTFARSELMRRASTLAGSATTT
jgi:hypothetical protein